MSWKKKYKRDWLNWRRYSVGEWKMVRLGEISSLITKGTTPTTLGYSFQDSGINFVKIESLTETGEFIPNKFQFISEECNQKLKRSMLEKNDILFSIAGALGRVAIVTDEILPANTNQALAIIRISCTKVYLKYATYALKSNYVFEQFQKQKQGVAQLNLSLRNIGDIEIPLPPLDIQQKIADILDISSAALEKRRAQIDKLDLLVKSQFIEMFGDPVTNPKGWIKERFDSISKVRQGLQIPISKRKLTQVPNSLPYITVQYINGNKQVEFIESPKDTVICTKDDVLMTRTGNTGLVVTDVEGVFHNNFFLIDFDRTQVNKIFLVNYLNTVAIQAELVRRAGSSTIPDLNHGEFYSIEIYLPPIELQKQFATFVQQVETQKSLLQASLEKLEINHKSLMQKAFREELF